MNLKTLSKTEYRVLSHFSQKNTLEPTDYDSVDEYNIQSDLALELFYNGLLLSDMEQPYRRNKSRSEGAYLVVGPLRLSPKAIAITNRSYKAHVLRVCLVWLVTSGTAVGIIGMLATL